MKIIKIDTNQTEEIVKADIDQTMSALNITSSIIKKGYSPYINEHKTWMVYDDYLKQFIDTGVVAEGKDGKDITIISYIPSTEDDGYNIITFSDNTIVKIKNGSKGSKGDKGDRGDKGEQGIRGEQGIPGKDGEDYVITQSDYQEIANVVYDDYHEQLKGDKGDTGEQGIPGKDYEITEKDYESISNVVYEEYHDRLKGDKGDDGYTPQKGIDYTDGFSPIANVSKSDKTVTITITDKNGTTIASVDDGKDGYTPQKNIDYFDGKDGISVTHEWEGTTLVITSASGTSSSDLKGDKGDSYTITEEDYDEIADITKSKINIPVHDVKVNNESVVVETIANITVPTKTSDITNDSNYVSDETYVHTDNNYTTDEKNKVAELENYDDTELREKINEIELAKFPNVTIKGQPTIQQGQISNFSSDNYCMFPFLVDFKNQAFEIQFEFTTGSEVINQHNVLDSVFGLAFAVRNSRFVIAISTNGTSWNIGEGIGTYEVIPNSTYRVKMIWDKVNFVVSYSIDGGSTYIVDIIKPLTEQPYPKQIFIGVTSDRKTIFNGSINLNYAQLSINDKVVWLGMDNIGIASRLATDLSNIDEKGKEEIRDIVNIDEIKNLLPYGDLIVESKPKTYIELTDGQKYTFVDDENFHTFSNVPYGYHLIKALKDNITSSLNFYFYNKLMNIQIFTGIPENLKKLQYIEVPGGATGATKSTFDSGIVPDSTIEVELEYFYNNTLGQSSGQGVVLGGRISSSSWVFTISGYSTTPTGYFGVNNNVRQSAGLIKGINTITVKNSEFDPKIGVYTCTNSSGVTTHTFDRIDYPTNMYSLYVGSLNNANSSSENLNGYIYYIRIWQKGELVRNYIPCIDTLTNAAGLYDTVTQKFNVATGTAFKPGPDAD